MFIYAIFLFQLIHQRSVLTFFTMESRNSSQFRHSSSHLSYLLYVLSRRIARLCLRLCRLSWKCLKQRLVIRRRTKLSKKPKASVIVVGKIKSTSAQGRIHLTTVSAILCSDVHAVPATRRLVFRLWPSTPAQLPKYPPEELPQKSPCYPIVDI